MQLYQGIPVLSNQPTQEEKQVVQHHLVSVADPSQRWDTMRYVHEAGKVLVDLESRNCQPVFCGGTGLYLRALIEGLDPLPAGDPEIRKRLLAEAAEHEPNWLHQQLVLCDPESAERLPANDEHRIVRALEVFEVSGKPMGQFFGAGGKPEITDFSIIGLDPDREKLYERIDARVEQMWTQGAVDEVKFLRSMGGCQTVMQAIGVRQICAWLDGEMSEDDAKERMKRDTRRYAKRQMTWFRKVEGIQWHQGELGKDELLELADGIAG